jgi:dihydropteroate synthase
MPIVEALADCGKPLSIDTYKPEVMRAALAGGADLINDIWGFRMPGAVEAVAAGQAGCASCTCSAIPRPCRKIRTTPMWWPRSHLSGERVSTLRAAGVDDAHF